MEVLSLGCELREFGLLYTLSFYGFPGHPFLLGWLVTMATVWGLALRPTLALS